VSFGEGIEGPNVSLVAGAMTEPRDQRSFIWVIDHADKIVFVNDDWLAFARENDAPHISASSVLDQPLWRFIQGQETIQIYKQIFGKLRAGKSPLKFPFRCDSPECRRFMEVELDLLLENGVQLTSKILRKEPRPPMDLLSPSGQESEEFLRICSWCKKVYLPEGEWVEVEDAVRALDLFGPPSMPRITHTICNACKDFVSMEFIQE
jgi:hypothetical protein